MQIFGRETLTCDQLWQLYTRISESNEIWQAASFKITGKNCGLKSILQRKTYFTFAASNFTTGQAIVTNSLIEEIRFFIGNEPTGLDEAGFIKDRHKHKKLAKEFSNMLTEKLGASWQLHSNQIFEHNGHRVRVLATGSANVWVVMSNLAIQKQLNINYFAKE